MVKIQIDIPKKINDKLEHFKIDNDCKDKRDAVVLALTQFFK